jgi:hypothetical protein
MEEETVADHNLSMPAFTAFTKDVLFGLRVLRRSPSFTAQTFLYMRVRDTNDHFCNSPDLLKSSF